MRSYAALRSSLFVALGLAGCDSAGTGPVIAGPGECENPQPILLAGDVDSGYVRCADGAINRVSVVDCPDPLPAGKTCSVGDGDCATDADCTDRPFGRCTESPNPGDDTQSFCECTYGCASDGDCAASAACICAGITDPDRGSRCGTNDCGPTLDCDGSACGLSSNYECRFSFGLACRTDADTCRSRDDCEASEGCGTEVGESFGCNQTSCAEGRPLIVDGEARVAEPAHRNDWLSEIAVAAAIPPPTRAALAERWANIAAFEHASIGSFARFTLQLLAIGAPADLLADTQRAALDEVEHARLAYGLASSFAGQPIGPGPLPESTAPLPTSPEDIVCALVIEGCVGETLGVAEVLALADACVEPAIGKVLRTIAADEERHAALAWRALAWMVSRDPTLGAVARAAALAPRPSFDEAIDAVIDRGRGLFSARELSDVRQQAFHEVVEPCLREVLGQARAHEGSSSAATSPARRALEI